MASRASATATPRRTPAANPITMLRIGTGLLGRFGTSGSFTTVALAAGSEGATACGRCAPCGRGVEPSAGTSVAKESAIAAASSAARFGSVSVTVTVNSIDFGVYFTCVWLTTASGLIPSWKLTDRTLCYGAPAGDLGVRQPVLCGLPAPVHIVDVGFTGNRDEDRGRRLVNLRLKDRDGCRTDHARQQRARNQFPACTERLNKGAEIHPLNLSFRRDTKRRATILFAGTRGANPIGIMQHRRSNPTVRRTLPVPFAPAIHGRRTEVSTSQVGMSIVVMG